MRNLLVANWPGVYVPPLPPKKMAGNAESWLLEERRRHLEYFCLKISEIPYLWGSMEFQTFLNSKSTDLVSTIKAMLNQVNTHKIIER